jgi:hypothetical protein
LLAEVFLSTQVSNCSGGLPPMSAFGGKADISQRKADIKECPLLTQSGHW